MGTTESLQFCDPAVSRAKFEREIGEFRSLQRDFEGRGWFLSEAEFPTAFVVMGLPQMNPPAILWGVLFDFTNYDARPPSVSLVDPFTRIPYLHKNLPTYLNKALPAQEVALPGVEGGGFQVQGAQPLMQAHSPEDVPFLCLAGVREYHDHPGHSGDAWELHRPAGAGRLIRLLEIIHKYGSAPVRGYGVQLLPQVRIDPGDPPA